MSQIPSSFKRNFLKKVLQKYQKVKVISYSKQQTFLKVLSAKVKFLQ